MLTDKYKSFIEKTSINLISSYEKATNKKYNPNDLNSIIDVIQFLNGDLIYVNDLYSKYKTDELLLTQSGNSFLIIIDKEHIEKKHIDAELDIKKSCFRMLWMYINEHIDNIGEEHDIIPNKIIYPQNDYISLQGILNIIKENNVQIQKKLKLERN